MLRGGGGMSGVDFSDREKVISWLEKQSVEVRCAISSRAALRICANICHFEEKWLSQTALPVLRAMLTSSVSGTGRATDVDWLRFAAHTASDASNNIGAITSRCSAAVRSAAKHSASSASAASAAALSASAYSASSAANFAVYSSACAASSAADFTSGEFTVTSSPSPHRMAASASASGAASVSAFSAASIDSLNKEVTNYLTPLWVDIAVPEAIAENHKAFLNILEADRTTWGFWHDWYLAMWEGRFTDWDVAIEVARISDDIWKDGAEAVATEISKIEARQKVRDALRDLPSAEATSKVSRHGIGGNAPPEALEDIADLASQATIIWAGVQALEKEAYAPAPDKGRVQAAIALLQKGSLACLNWFGRKADLTVEELIKWGVPTGAAHLLLNQQKVQALIDVAIKWAGLL